MRWGNSEVPATVLLVAGLRHHPHQFFLAGPVQVLGRIEAGRVFQFRQRLVVVASRHQAGRQRVMVLRRRFESNGLTEFFLRLIKGLRLEQRGSQIMMRNC